MSRTSLRSVLNLAKIALFLLIETPFRPRWAYYRARAYAYHYLLNRRHQSRLGEYRKHQRGFVDGVAYVLGRSEADVSAADDSELIRSLVVQDPWVVSLGEYVGGKTYPSGGPIEIHYGPSPELMRLVNVVSRLVQPDKVLETGVAKGFTTAATLEALERNQRGRLYSIEMPSLYLGYARQVGERIPDPLRHRWELVQGPSAVMMPKLLAKIGPIDVFVHDSACNYDNQLTEYRIALEHMEAGAVLISDMLSSEAFLETAEATPCRWAVIEHTKPHPLGILCKTG